jgi:tRNA(fMet)-specific endonuclease VapC
MPFFMLDTDHVSLYQYGHAVVREKCDSLSNTELVISVVSYEEQLRGRLAVIRESKDAEELTEAYLRLREMQEFFCGFRLVDFDITAEEIFAKLRKIHRRTKTMDLRIAATALAHDATLVTRNTKDFIDIENLRLDNWA